MSLPGPVEPTLASLRRDRLLLWLWIPVGLLLIIGVTQLWQRVVGEPTRGLVTTLNVLWVVTTLMLIWRNSSRRCVVCGHRYLRAYPWMSLKRVRCPSCGHELK